MTPLEAALRRDVAGEVRFDDYTRHLFARDASMYAITPRGVVFPRDADDVAATLVHARAHGVPVVPRGAGTSLAGQTVGPGLVVDLSRHLREIVALDPAARVAVVQPGVVQDDLNRAAAPYGLMLGPDTSTSNRATLGGMIGNNSAGSGSVRHGMTIDHVRELDVVLADGSFARFGPLTERERARRAAADTLEGRIHRELPGILAAHADAIATDFPPYWRRAGGYRLDRLAAGFDLARFLVGSEGTLAVVTRATVDLVPRPARTVFAVGYFHSVREAIAATGDALVCDPSAVELMDRTILDLARRRGDYPGTDPLPGALLFVSLSSDNEQELTIRLDELRSLWERHWHGYRTVRAVTAQEQAALLKIRKSSLGLLMAAGTGTLRPLAFIEDTAVDPLVLRDYTARVAAILDEHGLRAGFYGHCSVGCLHIRPFVDLTDPGQVTTMRTVAARVKDLVAEFGGVNSSEHGDGLARSEFNREVFGPELYAAMRAVKRLFDPDGVLNPGKIVDAPPMTAHLRDAALPPDRSGRTRLAFDVVGGMRGAADRCMNIGLCRKVGSGVMCPSYMVSHDEEQTPRGRANALFKAVSEDDLGNPRLHDILDTCVMCKACSAECPLGVDIAALKAETLGRGPVTARSRLFGAIRELNRLGSATAPLANRIAGLRWPRRLLGLTPHRPLPPFERRTLIGWFRDRTPPGDAARPAVVLLADSFTTFTEPGVGRAAVELLELAGWRVRLESGGCCGRASYSKGLLADARRRARDLTTRLAAVPEVPVVGCEPSCLHTLTDEHRRLLPGDPHVADVAGRVTQLDDLLLAALDDGRLTLADSWLTGRRILFHGHCHQKAAVGTASTVALLRRIPGAEVTELDAGCCGMAGSFGYEAEHYATSLRMGEQRLFPAVRAAPADAVIAATGTSCRQQIQHGTERRAWHPLQLVRAAA